MKFSKTPFLMTPWLAVLLLCLPLTPALADHAGRHKCDSQEMITLPFVEGDVTGSSSLCVGRKGLRGGIELKGLVPGNAYTVWWVYFDDPSLCDVPNQCGPPDFYGSDPHAVLGRFGSTVAGKRGKAYLLDSIEGMKAASGSEVQFLVFGHGPADYSDTKHLARQLLTPEDPTIGAPHLGVAPLGYPVSLGIHSVD